MNAEVISRRVSLLLVMFAACATAAFAQTTSFTYQGRLTDGGTAANGNYDLQFALFDAVSGGAQVGTTQSKPNIAVSAGVFTVTLDFGANAFPGANRWLEIGTRLTGSPSFTTLSPRQQISSTPYAVRSLNAASADAVTVSGVPAGSGNYLQTNPSSQQAGSFNISGNGTAGGTLSGNVVTAATQYEIAGLGRVLSVGNIIKNNIFVGGDAGTSATTGFHNTFVGGSSGRNTTDGFRNSFFGAAAGGFNVSGSDNTLVGSFAQVASGALTNATAIGACAEVGQSNALVLGSIAGCNGNTFTNVGIGTTTPQAKLNVVGSSWFQGDTTPLPNTAGKGIVMGFAGEQGYISSFDYGAFTGKNLLLNNSGGNVGIGTATPLAVLHVNGGALVTTGSNREVSIGNPNGESGIGIKGTSNRADVRFDSSALRLVAGTGTGPPLATSGISITTSGNVGIGQTSPLAKLDVAGTLKVDSLAGGGDVSLCRNSAFNTLATCSSSLRYKKQIASYSSGLELINRLHPITFSWKSSGKRDLGLGAEDVAKIEPLLVTFNDNGEVEGVKYDHLNVILINAIKQQQEQIAEQRGQIEQLQQQQQRTAAQEARFTQQQQEIAQLKKLLCLHHRRSRVCK